MTLRAEEIVAALDLHKVRYVVIGGLGAVLHGSPIVTQDADICPARDRENLGTTGYGDLERNAVIYEIAGRKVAVASLDDIIRSKEAANREKDRAVLPTLRLHNRMLREKAGLRDYDSSR